MQKTALITGSSRGIGARMAIDFAQNGWHVIINYMKHHEQAEKILAQCGGCATLFPFDVRSPEFTATITENFPNIDLLINNAGIAMQKLFQDTTSADWHDIFATNLHGTVNAIQGVLPNMLKRKSGAIINIASIWGEIGGSCEVAYSASKSAIIGLTKALSKELAPSNIRVNAISPGAIQTDMLNENLDVPIGTPKDVSSAALFLASDAAHFINGQILSVNGGWNGE